MIAPTRAPWLEPHDEFEGVGAHELNPRYDHVDDGPGYDATLEVSAVVPKLVAARQSLLGPTTPRLDGIDVSHYQYDAGVLNWQQVATIPTFWAATKLTQSVNYLDPTAQRSRLAMSAVGFRHRGLYHWLSSTSDPVAQARYFLSKMGALGAGEFVMLDAEEAGITVAGVTAWCEAVEAFTRRPCAVYSGAYVAGGSIWTDARVRQSAYGDRPMAFAAYTTEAKAKALPGVAANPWSSWQFSSNGPVRGVAGRCDMNRVDNVGIFDQACGLNIPKPTPTPAPVPETPTPTPAPIPTPIPAPPITGDDMHVTIYTLTDANAVLIAETNSRGVALVCRWSGPGGAKWDAFRAAHIAAGAIDDRTHSVADFANVYLEGPLPQGDGRHAWSLNDFANAPG